jgi:hypothetical protein
MRLAVADLKFACQQSYRATRRARAIAVRHRRGNANAVPRAHHSGAFFRDYAVNKASPMKEKPETTALKLFALGEVSGDPKDWGDCPAFRAFVIAKDEDDALRIADRPPRENVAEVNLNGSGALLASLGSF